MMLPVLKIISISFLLLSACSSDKKEEHKQHINVDTLNKSNSTSLQLESLLKPTNQFVISKIPVTAIKKDRVVTDINAVGTIEYDTKMIGNISARIDGRIEKLYVRYKYQFIKKGQKIMDIYSPELLTAQENLLFIVKNDAGNISLLKAAKQKLLLLGFSYKQLEATLQTGKPIFYVSIYSNYTGHLHNAGENFATMPTQANSSSMGAVNPSTELLNFKEGMYIQKGQTLFTIYDPSHAWVLLNIYNDGQSSIKKGQFVKIIPEAAPASTIHGRIDFIEPFYKEGNKTASARVYFDNSKLRIPIGSQVRGLISSSTNGYWLPKEAVNSLGIHSIVFLKLENGFKPNKVITGKTTHKNIQIISGLSDTDSVAIQSQYLMDSESFIKVNE